MSKSPKNKIPRFRIEPISRCPETNQQRRLSYEARKNAAKLYHVTLKVSIYC